MYGSRLSERTEARNAPAYSPHARAAEKASPSQRRQRTSSRLSLATVPVEGSPHFQHKVSSPVKMWVWLQQFIQATPKSRDSTLPPQTSQACGYTRASKES